MLLKQSLHIFTRLSIECVFHSLLIFKLSLLLKSKLFPPNANIPAIAIIKTQAPFHPSLLFRPSLLLGTLKYDFYPPRARLQQFLGSIWLYVITERLHWGKTWQQALLLKHTPIEWSSQPLNAVAVLTCTAAVYQVLLLQLTPVEYTF